MRLQELFETTEEDRALISLSSAIYKKIESYTTGNLDYDNIFDVPEEELIKIGKIGDMFDTPIEGFDDISIELQGNDPFIERAKSPKETAADYIGKNIYGFYNENTHTIVLNLDYAHTHSMKTAITHELRHALDDLKSGSFPASPKNPDPENINRYFTPKKKEHRKDDPYSTLQYRAQPAEINARFIEMLDILSKRIPKWIDKLPFDQVRPQVMNDLKHLFVKFEIADIFPEKTQSRDYKRLMKRAVDFIDKEISYQSKK